jgi:hypothetical protein
MMLSELITGLWAIEGNMIIEEGSSSNYLVHQTAAELAFVDSSDPKTEHVTVVPSSILRKGGRIEHPELPVDVEVVQYMVNAELRKRAAEDGENLATKGTGLSLTAIQKKEGSGVDADQMVDQPAGYLKLLKKGTDQVVGTYLFGVALRLPERVPLDDKTYEVSLRLKRTYKPYTIYLREFRHKLFLGTKTPKDFSSVIHLVDPERHEDREATISMNAPLSYAGETFYQQSFLRDERGDDQGTILQVVRNPGSFMPYLSCAMISFGMLVHFGIHLLGFLRLRAAK